MLPELTLKRLHEAESKVFQIMEWLNACLYDDPTASDNPSIPTLVVSQEHDDFSPALGTSPNKQSTITLNASKRAALSQMDMASFSSKFGTLTLSGRGKSKNGMGGIGGLSGMRMLKEESRFGLADVANGEEDEMF
jgi:hypothetical protein